MAQLMMPRTVGCTLAGLAAFLDGAPAAAIEPPTIHDNAQTYHLGSRAAGMAGAYTSLGCDESALVYNPAALACSDRSHLELAANAYSLQGYAVPDAFGLGERVDATSFQAIPATAGGVYVLIDPEDEDTHVGELSGGLLVTVPRSILIQAEPADPKKRDFVSFSTLDTVTVLDLGLAYQPWRWLGVGVSIGGGLRTLSSRTTALVTSGSFFCSAEGDQQCNDFVLSQAETDLNAIGLRGKLGVRLTPDEHWAVGVTAVSPSIDVFGSAQFNTLSAQAFNGVPARGEVFTVGTPTRSSGTSQLGFPGRFAVGVSYSSDAFTIAVDGSLDLPRSVCQACDLEPVGIAGIVPDAPPDDRRRYGLRPNASIGMEIEVVKDVLVDLGAYTDLSAVDEDDPNVADRIHMFGGALGIALRGAQSTSFFGLNGAYGRGTTRTVSGAFTLQNALDAGGALSFDAESSVTRWALTGVVGASYAFVDLDAVAHILDGDETDETDETDEENGDTEGGTRDAGDASDTSEAPLMPAPMRSSTSAPPGDERAPDGDPPTEREPEPGGDTAADGDGPDTDPSRGEDTSPDADPSGADDTSPDDAPPADP